MAVFYGLDLKIFLEEYLVYVFVFGELADDLLGLLLLSSADEGARALGDVIHQQ